MFRVFWWHLRCVWSPLANHVFSLTSHPSLPPVWYLIFVGLSVFYILLSHAGHLKLLPLCLTLCNPMDCSPSAPMSLEFSRQEYWGGLPCPSLGDCHHPGIEPASLTSPALAGVFFTTSATWGAQFHWPKPLYVDFYWRFQVTKGDNMQPRQWSTVNIRSEKSLRDSCPWKLSYDQFLAKSQVDIQLLGSSLFSLFRLSGYILLLPCFLLQSNVALLENSPCFLNKEIIKVFDWIRAFSHSSVGKESVCNAADPGSIPGLGRSTGEGVGYPLQYSWASLWLSW